MENEKALVGRPVKYKNKEEIEEKINKYFASCFKILTNKKGNAALDIQGNPIMIRVRPYTMSGLADALDLSRQGLLNYTNKEEFFDTIERARRKVEMYAEESLFEKETVNGAKFSLSNNFNGWKDRKETEHTGSIRLEDVL